ncbi:MAG: methyl-accepting chemotaxis protein [Deltaproteobacteria bacterium]|nr:methyl-accepting chemotaxis protein [Deltaproteobacteria bacterium]
MKNFNKISITLKMVLMGVSLVVISVGILILIQNIGDSKSRRKTDTIIKSISQSNLEQMSVAIREMIISQEASLKKKISESIAVTWSIHDTLGKISADATAVREVSVKNQYTGEIEKIKLPVLKIGKTPLPYTDNFSVEVPLVDRVQSLVGGTVTVFQRMKGGSLLRVATNVKKLDGKRAVGTFIPYNNPDGKVNPVAKSINEGKSYRGRAYVVNAWYYTVYEPIKDKKGTVIGALYYGERVEHISEFRKALQSIRVGKTGYVFVLGASGKEKGRYIISADGKSDGKSVWNLKDHSGRYFGRVMVEKAIAAGGKTTMCQYDLRNKGESKARSKIASVFYFKHFDWIVGVSAYEDDFDEINKILKDNSNQTNGFFLISGLMILLAGSIFSFYFSRKIVKPILHVRDFLKEMSDGEGDLTKRISITSSDETGEMGEYFNKFVEYLASIIRELAMTSGRLNNSSVALGSTFTSLSEAVSSMQVQTGKVTDGFSDLNENIRTVAAATEEISTTIDEVSSTAEQMSMSINSVNIGAGEMSSNIATIAVSIEELTASLGEVSSSFAQAAQASTDSNDRAQNAGNQMTLLGKSAKDIAKVIEMINDIADQTNLLALNATIEAASAGDAGKGFTVVAQEIKELAKQTAKATDDIANEVNSMQDVTSSTIRMITEVAQLIAKVTSLANTVAAAVEEQTATVGELSGSITSGAGAAEDISRRLGEVSTGVMTVAASTTEAASGVTAVSSSTSEIASLSTSLMDKVTLMNQVMSEAKSETDKIESEASEVFKLSGDIDSIVNKFKV